MLLGEGLCFSLRLCWETGILGGARKVSLARRGSSFRKERNRSAEENLLLSTERKNCVRTQGNFYAHTNKFSCARKYFFVRTEFERFTQALLSPCPSPSFSLANCPPIPRGLPRGTCPPAEGPSVHRGILPYKPYLCIPQWLGGSHPTLKGRAFQRINDDDAKIRYP